MFDLLYDGRDLRTLPLREPRKLLESALASAIGEILLSVDASGSDCCASLVSTVLKAL
ncbi:hypothetical protein [Sinorhizobium medicae]|uniref:hypothetical protein n=1 Tax=Sinorhizobium medicae TaxID=110321 RepID=UPI001F1913D1|nr:hypothetical protein [Sinorhizobium medicae]